MNEHEAKVRDFWKLVQLFVPHTGSFSVLYGDPSNPYGADSSSTCVETVWRWAGEATDHRKQEIAEVEEELRWLRGFGHIGSCNCCGVRDRIITRTEAHLADLKRGMKETK